MRILVIGSGGREDALCWKLAQSPRTEELFCAPGNPGTGRYAKNVTPGDLSAPALADWAETHHVDLTVVGPEAFLAAGLGDTFRQRGLTVFGPSRAAAAIETSKSFAKGIMKQAGVPTPQYAVFTSSAPALAYLGETGYPAVIKQDGLAAGKGVRVCLNSAEGRDAIAHFRPTPEEPVIIEEFLTGREISVFGICNGTRAVLMQACRDHKRLGNGDTGPNTGGMGAFTPVSDASSDLMESLQRDVFEPVLSVLGITGLPFQGLLYAGIMLTSSGPKVLEFNSRFGDPETQALLPVLADDLADLLYAAARGEDVPASLSWQSNASVCVVLAAPGYPDSPERGLPITGIAAACEEGCMVFHAGTSAENGQIVTAGGRVLNVVATGPSWPEALERVYRGVGRIGFQGVQFRTDIGCTEYRRDS